MHLVRQVACPANLQQFSPSAFLGALAKSVLRAGHVFRPTVLRLSDGLVYQASSSFSGGSQFIIVDLAQLPLKHFFPSAVAFIYPLQATFQSAQHFPFSCHFQHSHFSPWYAFLFHRLAESCWKSPTCGADRLIIWTKLLTPQCLGRLFD